MLIIIQNSHGNYIITIIQFDKKHADHMCSGRFEYDISTLHFMDNISMAINGIRVDERI